MRNNRGSVDVVLLVFLAVVLSGFTLFTFISNSSFVSSQVKDVRFLDNFYVNENRAEFYIDGIMEEVIKEIDNDGDVKSQFIEKFNEKFENYKTKDVFLFFDLNKDLTNSENVWIEDNKIFLKVNFKGNEKFGDTIKVTYLSKKVFIKEF